MKELGKLAGITIQQMSQKRAETFRDEIDSFMLPLVGKFKYLPKFITRHIFTLINRQTKESNIVIYELYKFGKLIGKKKIKMY